MTKKFILLTLFIATFMLSCQTLQDAVIVAIVTHNLQGTVSPSPYLGDFDDYPEPSQKEPKVKKTREPKPKKEKPVKEKQTKEKPTSVDKYAPRYRIELADAGYTLIISKPIVFAPREMTMNRKYEDSIDIVLEFLEDYTNAKLIVEGHPDNLSDPSYSYMLSRVRASAVYDELVDSGVKDNRLLFFENGKKMNNAAASMNNEAIRFIIINDMEAYAHYLAYLRKYETLHPNAVLTREPLPSNLKEPVSPNNDKTLVVRDGSGNVMSQPTKKEPAVKTNEQVVKKEPTPQKIDTPKKEKVVKAPAPKKVAPAKKEKVSKKKENVETPKQVEIKEELPLYVVERVDGLNVLRTRTPILFNENSYTILSKYRDSIGDIVSFMNVNTNTRLVIEGYNDDINNRDIKLTVSRGESIYSELLRNGVDRNRLLLHGSSSDLNNTNVLLDNNSMRFVVIKDSYNYYDYIKYLRNYKAKNSISTQKNVVEDNKATEPKEIKKETTPQRIEAPKKEKVVKASAPKKEAPAKKETTQKSVEEIDEKIPNYIVERVNNLNVLRTSEPMVFSPNSHLIPVAYKESLEDVISFMNDNTNARLVIEGHGDKTTNTNSDIKLSEARGNTLYKALVRSGIDRERLLLPNNNSDEIYNTDVLLDNDSMRFVIIKDSYGYYEYIKYLRAYKSKPVVTEVAQVTKVPTKPNIYDDIDIFDLSDSSDASSKNKNQAKAQSPKKEAPAKKEKVVKAPAPKKEPPAKKEKVAKATKNNTKAKSGPKVEYRVLKSANMYILLEENPIAFEKGKSLLNEKSYKKSIDYIIGFLNASTNSRLVIEGYSDKVGTSNQYVAISKARGSSVYEKLIDSGIDENRLLLYGSNNDLNNAHVLLDNDNMRFIIIKDKQAYQDYVNYIRRYVPKAKPVIEIEKPKATIDIKKPETIVKNIIPINDPNATIVIINEEDYKKELAAKDVGSKKATDKKTTAKKEPAPKKTAKNTKPVKEDIVQTAAVNYRVEKIDGFNLLLPSELIVFDNKSAKMSSKYKSSVNDITEFLNANTNAKLVIEGYSDKTLNTNDNIKLSHNRAVIIYNELVSAGIDNERLLLYNTNDAINNNKVVLDNDYMRFIVIDGNSSYYNYINYLRNYKPASRVSMDNFYAVNDSSADDDNKASKKTTTKKEPAPKKEKVAKTPAPKKEKVAKAPKKEATPKKTASSRNSKANAEENTKEIIKQKEYRIELSNGLQVLLAPQSIAFDYQSAIVDSRYKSSINNIADYLKENPDIKMVIEGNAYESGTDNYNLILSKARANSVYNELLRGGIGRDRLLLHSVGNKTISANGNSPKENRIIRFVIIRSQSDYSRYLDYLKRAGI